MEGSAKGKDGSGSGGVGGSHRLIPRRLLLIGLTNLVGAACSILLLPILTRNLTAGEYGTWVLVLATATLMPLVVDLGLPGAMVRFLAVERRKERIQEGFCSVLLVVLCTACAVSLGLSLLAPWVADVLLPGHSHTLRVLAVIVLVECLNAVLFNYLRTFQRIKLYSGFIILQTLLLVGLLLVTLVSGMGFEGAVLSLLASRSVTMLSMLVLVVREVGLRWPAFSRLREFLGFGLPMIPGDLSDWALLSADRYLIGLLIGVAFVGYYAPGYALGVVVLMLVSPLQFLLPAALSELYDRGEVDRVRSYIGRALKYFLVLAIPAGVGLGLLSRELLGVLTTPEIAGEGYAVTPVVAAAMVLYGAQIVLAQVLIVEKRTRELGLVMTATAGLNVALNLVTIPAWGIMGAAVSTLVSYAFALVATGQRSLSRMRVQLDLRALAKGVVASLLMAAAILYLRDTLPVEGMPLVAVAVLAGAGVYAAASLGLRVVPMDELRSLMGLLRGGWGG